MYVFTLNFGYDFILFSILFLGHPVAGPKSGNPTPTGDLAWQWLLSIHSAIGGKTGKPQGATDHSAVSVHTLL